METNEIEAAAEVLRNALRRHEVERKRPVSCTDAGRTHTAVVDAHAHLARVMAGGHGHMTPAERSYLDLAPAELLRVVDKD